MDSCKSLIQHNRPKLSDSSVRTYCNILKNLYKAVFGDEFDHKKFWEHPETVMAHLKTVTFSVRKTVLSALVVLTEGHKCQEKYRTVMVEDAQKYNTEQKANKMTDIQKDNWMSWSEVEQHLADLKKKYYYIITKPNPTQQELFDLQKYIILSCYVSIPPRRLQDYTLMKVRNFNKEEGEDNYYEKGTLTFRVYKTARFSGVQKEKVPKALEILISKWIKIHPGNHLFSDMYGQPLRGSALTKILNGIFAPHKISVNMLRHIFITEKSAPLMRQLDETARLMGHSSNQAELYVKH